MSATSIQWTDATWNPVRGCSRISEGCRNCYAERQAARFSDPGQYAHGFVTRTPSGPRWTGKLALVPEKLREPLTWRKPSRVFVNSMSDLFHESLPDEAIAAVFGVMARSPQHAFQVLTKRPERMRAFFRQHDPQGSFIAAARRNGLTRMAPPSRGEWLDHSPLPNVWLGVSVEDQASADARIPALLDTPAAVRFLSVEPLLGPVDPLRACISHGLPHLALDWIIVGGESGPGARPCELRWIRSIVGQCAASGVACFVKQLGACAIEDYETEPFEPNSKRRLQIASTKGGDPAEWPADLRVREFPAPAAAKVAL